MPLECPRCRIANPDVARFCRHCGLPLELGPAGVLAAGRGPHPEPLDPPDGFEPIDSAANLHFLWQAAGGGRPLLGTEPLELTVFNGGYDLADVLLRVHGVDKAGQPLLALEREIAEWPRGGSLRLEIASYELPDAVCGLRVELVKAEFAVQS